MTPAVTLIVFWSSLAPAYHDFPSWESCIAAGHAVVSSSGRTFAKALCVDSDGNTEPPKPPSASSEWRWFNLPPCQWGILPPDAGDFFAGAGKVINPNTGKLVDCR